MHPLLSVVLAVRNGAPTIAQQLEALSNQESEIPFEVIVVDHGSTDNTEAIVRSYSQADARFRLIDGSFLESGGAVSKNFGVRHASADLLAFCDADDVVNAQWVGSIFEALQEVDLVFARLEFHSLNPPWVARSRSEYSDDAGGGAFGISKRWYEKLGMFNEHFRGAVDSEFFLRAEKAGLSTRHIDSAIVKVRLPRSVADVFRRERELHKSATELEAQGLRQTRPKRILLAKVIYLFKVSIFVFSKAGRYKFSSNLGALWGRLEGLRLLRGLNRSKERLDCVAMTLSWESADFLPRLIESTLGWADRFLILDTGSTDGSQQLLAQYAERDPRLIVFHTQTNAETFNRGRCLNILLSELERQSFIPEWLAVVDCDEIFEKDFEALEFPIIKRLPRIITQVSFRRPDLWYSEDLARDDGLHATFQEQPFQRYRKGFRYQEAKFHLLRSMHRPSFVYPAQSFLLHYELRDPERSKLQFERLKVIDKEWNALLLPPEKSPVLRRIDPLAARWQQPRLGFFTIFNIVWSQAWIKVRSRLPSRTGI